MGIRINVNLGWGFPKVKQNDPRFTAEFLKRWNDGKADLLPEFRSAVVKAKKEATPTPGEYNRDQGDAELLLQRIDAKNWFDKKEPIKHLRFYEVLRQSGFAYEGRRVSPLIFVPIEHDEWSRHDDIIDYYKAGREPKDKVEIVKDEGGYPCPIYPYACYVNRKNGEPIPNGSMVAEFRRGWGKVKPDFSKPLTKLLSADMVKKLKAVGITAGEHLRDDIVPEPPFSIRLFCKTFNVFNDPFELYNTVPMIYTYWC